MADDMSQTIAAENPVKEILESLPTPAGPTPPSEEVQALFDSIAEEKINILEEPARAPLKNFFTVLMWFGYAIAIVVALVLVWSAANSLIKSLPR
jgi:hypothetical protein